MLNLKKRKTRNSSTMVEFSHIMLLKPAEVLHRNLIGVWPEKTSLAWCEHKQI